MLKRWVSSLVVFSFLWMDIAPLIAMESEGSSTGHVRRLSNPLADIPPDDSLTSSFPKASPQTLPHTPISSDTDSTASPENVSMGSGSPDKISSSEPSPRELDVHSFSLQPQEKEESENDDHSSHPSLETQTGHSSGRVSPSQDIRKSEDKDETVEISLSGSFRALNPTELTQFTSSGSRSPRDSETSDASETSSAIADLERLLGSPPPRKKGRGEKFLENPTNPLLSSDAPPPRKSQSINSDTVSLITTPSSPQFSDIQSDSNEIYHLTLIKNLLSLTPQEIALFVSQAQTSSHHPLDDLSMDDDITQKTPLLSGSINSSSYGTDDLEHGSIPSKQAFFINFLADLLNQDTDKTATLFEAWMGQYTNQSFENWIKDLANQNKNLFEESLAALNETSSDLTVGGWWQGYLTSSDQPLLSESKAIIALSFAKHLLTKQFENGDDPTKRLQALLTYAKKHTVEWDILPRQIILCIVGGLIAAGSSVTMGTTFKWNFNTLFDNLGLGDYWDGATPYSEPVVFGTMILAFLEAFPRNLQTFWQWGKASKSDFISPKTSWQKFISVVKEVGYYALGVVPAYVTTSYFTSIGADGIEYARYYKLDPTQYYLYYGILTPFLFIDSLISSKSMAQNAIRLIGKRFTRMREWFSSSLMSCSLRQFPMSLSHEEQVKGDVLNTLEIMKKAISRMNTVKDSFMIHTLFTQILEPLLENRKEKGKIHTDAEEMFATLAFLTNLSKKTSLEKNNHEDLYLSRSSNRPLDWKNYLATTMSVLVTESGSVLRALVYYNVSHDLFSSFISSKRAVEGLSYIFAGLGFCIQSLVDQMACEDNFKGTFLGKREYSPHPWIKKGLAAISVLMGIYFALPYIVTGWEAMSDMNWLLMIQGIHLIPALFSDSLTNTQGLNETYGLYPQAFDKIKAKIVGKENMSAAYKKGELLNLMEEWKDLIQQADPNAVDYLNTLNKFVTLGSLDSVNDNTQFIELDDAV